MTWKLSISGYWQHQSNQPWCWNGWLNCTEKKNLSGLEKISFVWFEKTNSKTQHISIFSLKFCAKIKDLCFSWYKKQCQEMGHFWRLSAWTMGVREISRTPKFFAHTILTCFSSTFRYVKILPELDKQFFRKIIFSTPCDLQKTGKNCQLSLFTPCGIPRIIKEE